MDFSSEIDLSSEIDFSGEIDFTEKGLGVRWTGGNSHFSTILAHPPSTLW